MIIRTPERRLAVLRVLWSSEDEEISLCQDLSGSEEEISTLIRFRNPGRSRSLLPMLLAEKGNAAFEDFLGLFTQDGELFVRFRYSSEPPLDQLLEQGIFSLKEKLIIGENILERAALLDMPAPILFEVLREDNITVDEALRVRFNYMLKTPSNTSQTDIGFVCVRTAQLLRKLFEKELGAQSLPELLEYLETLENAQYDSCIEIYGGYDRFRQAVESRSQTGPVKPRTKLFRLWDKIKKLSRFVKPVLGGIVLIAAFCYLIYTLMAPPKPKGSPIVFDQIGTVEIEGQSTESSAP